MTGFRASFGPVHVEGLSFDGVDVPVGRAYITVTDTPPDGAEGRDDDLAVILGFLNSVDARALDAAMAASPSLSVGPGAAALKALAEIAQATP